jgi:hypothetical protein
MYFNGHVSVAQVLDDSLTLFLSIFFINVKTRRRLQYELCLLVNIFATLRPLQARNLQCTQKIQLIFGQHKTLFKNLKITIWDMN